MKGKTELFYGYWILVAGLICLFVTSGVGFYAFGIFFKPIQEEFNWSRGITSVAFTMLYLVQAAFSPLVGGLTDRYGPRKVIALGAAITGFGLFLLSLTASLPHFYAAYAVAGLGFSAMGTIPVSATVSNWFVKRRGMALGVAASGVGAGGLVLAPIIGTLLIPSFGWRTAYQILALLSIGLVVAVAKFVIKTSPGEMGLHPNGIEPLETVGKTGTSQSSEGWRLEAALKTTTFWLLVAAFVMFNMAQVGTIQHLVNHLTDIGFSATTATVVLSGVGLGSTIGKFLFGYVSDRLAAKYCAAISFLLVLSATLILITVDPTSPTVVTSTYTIVMGLGIGGWAPLQSVLISQNFGLAHYGTIYGALSLFHNVSTGVGPAFFGYVYDATQGYHGAFITSLVLYAAAIALILALRRPKPRQLQSH